ncbi:exonuclease domain-containing protein [Aeromicrobium sp. 9AM]|uniref:exonuclease domain-containing protein n=1 Tax=Aeromicrobium sp. 9AM TaxID=2653126 RepID=UPI0012EEED63|nr:exonuclease domain-containing protein [Aeromicrobium sp. 9AM]VXB82918.1 DNA polymerase III subunit epsilon [Aeromicrobium sp. 9AM]
MSWAAQTMYGFDVESTGVDVFTDRIVTSTITQVVPEGAGSPNSKQWLVNPGVPIPETATNVHGITDDMAAEGMAPAEAIEQIAHYVTWVLNQRLPLVAFNAAFDLSMLEAECRRHDLTPLAERLTSHENWRSVIDPMVLGKGVDTIKNHRFVKGRKFTLPALCEWYKVPFTETHDATADALGAVGLARAIADSDAYLGDMGPGALHQLQKTWRREMCHSLREYFDKNGIEHDGVDGGWPLHTQLQAVTA